MHIVGYKMQIQINMKNKDFFPPECFKNASIRNYAKLFKNFSLQAVKSKRSTSSNPNTTLEQFFCIGLGSICYLLCL